MQYKLNGRLNFVRNDDSLLVDIPGRIEGGNPHVDVTLRPGDTFVLLFTDLEPGGVITFEHYGDISFYCLARELPATAVKETQQALTE